MSPANSRCILLPRLHRTDNRLGNVKTILLLHNIVPATRKVLSHVNA